MPVRLGVEATPPTSLTLQYGPLLYQVYMLSMHCSVVTLLRIGRCVAYCHVSYLIAICLGTQIVLRFSALLSDHWPNNLISFHFFNIMSARAVAMPCYKKTFAVGKVRGILVPLWTMSLREVSLTYHYVCDGF